MWKFGGNKQSNRKNVDPFTNFMSKNEKALDGEENSCPDLVQENEVSTSHSLQILVRELLWDKNRDDIPVIVEGLLSRVTKEFEQKLASQNGYITTTSQVESAPISYKSVDSESETSNVITKDKSFSQKDFHSVAPDGYSLHLQVQNSSLRKEKFAGKKLPSRLLNQFLRIPVQGRKKFAGN